MDLNLHQQDSRTRFDLLKPDCERKVLEKQAEQKSSHDRHAKTREWFVGQRVMVRNARPGPNWVPATILEVRAWNSKLSGSTMQIS